jgi:FemAB-related protein (PEP-CTERM system-associated)
MSAERAAISGPSAETTEVRSLGAGDGAAWDKFVAAAPSATFFHLSGWRRIIEDVLGHRTHYLYAIRGTELTGVLPLAEVKSRLFGHSLISTPFCVYGGAAAASSGDRIALERRACDLAHELGVDYLELRNLEKSQGDWPSKDLYVTFRKRIFGSDDENMKAIPRKQRAMVRKGIDAQLSSEQDANADRFYAMYAESVRNLGTPVLGKRYFAALLEQFPGAVDITTIVHDARPVSSVMSFYFRDEILPYYGGGTSSARDLKANDFMYWALMCRAVAKGVSVFDFGRSKVGSGSFSFKKNWGFDPQPLEYQYHLVRARDVPNVSPTNPKYRALIATWQRLPVWVTQMIGPRIARYLG